MISVGVTRRALLGGLAVTAVVAVGAYALLPGGAPPEGASEMSPPQVLDAVQHGRVILIDVRRPDEWARTGLAQGAIPIDMRRPDFIAAVRNARGARNIPVALICARGVRSKRMTRQLIETGVTPIIDVPEGMLGSFAGPGWLKRALPVDVWTG